MLLADRLHLEAHGLKVAGGIGRLVTKHVQKNHGSCPLANPQPDCLGWFDLGPRPRLLTEDRVLRVIRVGLVIHLHAQPGVPQGRPCLIHRTADERRYLHQGYLRRSRIIATVDPQRVEEFQHQVTEDHQ